MYVFQLKSQHCLLSFSSIHIFELIFDVFVFSGALVGSVVDTILYNKGLLISPQPQKLTFSLGYSRYIFNSL